ncbi:MAG: hypothetical protein Q8736_02695, partial [Sweet potato little leaf phytoplasma]|nr:hypothetical protein [Sweet potato little leaf phytoplasma]
GFAKLIVEKDTLKILGMHIYAYNATELITESGTLMAFNVSAHKPSPFESLSRKITTVFLENSWSLTQRIQSETRNESVRVSKVLEQLVFCLFIVFCQSDCFSVE